MDQRVLQNTTAQLTATFMSGGNIADPGTVAVTVTTSDGTTVKSGTAGGSGAIARTYDLAPADTAQLDTLTVTWVSPSLGTIVTTVEVTGGFVFTTDRLRTRFPDSSTYPQAALEEARIYAEDELEDALGYALVPRFARETFNANGDTTLRLRPFLRAIRSISIDGVAQPLDNYSFNGSFLSGPKWPYWPTTLGNIVVEYEHGLASPPAGAVRAAVDVATDYLGGAAGATGTGIDPRATSIVTVDGTLQLVTGQRFSLPTVQAFVDANRIPSIA